MRDDHCGLVDTLSLTEGLDQRVSELIRVPAAGGAAATPPGDAARVRARKGGSAPQIPARPAACVQLGVSALQIRDRVLWIKSSESDTESSSCWADSVDKVPLSEDIVY